MTRLSSWSHKSANVSCLWATSSSWDSHTHTHPQAFLLEFPQAHQTQQIKKWFHGVLPFLYFLFPSVTCLCIGPIQKYCNHTKFLPISHSSDPTGPQACKNGELHVLLSFPLHLQWVRASQFLISFPTLGFYNYILRKSIFSLVLKHARHTSPLGWWLVLSSWSPVPQLSEKLTPSLSVLDSNVFFRDVFLNQPA